jgi:hypothetical protein
LNSVPEIRYFSGKKSKVDLSSRQGRTTFELSEYAAIKFIGGGQEKCWIDSKVDLSSALLTVYFYLLEQRNR